MSSILFNLATSYVSSSTASTRRSLRVSFLISELPTSYLVPIRETQRELVLAPSPGGRAASGLN